MNGLDKLAGAREIRFVKYMNIPDSQLTEFLVNIRKEPIMSNSKPNPEYEKATHEFVKQDYTSVNIGPIPDEYKLITSEKKPWCEIHQREAKYIFRGKPVCDPKLGGIMMPCQCRD